MIGSSQTINCSMKYNKKTRRNKMIVNANGDKFYFVNGLLHREDGPAVESADGYKAWYIKGIPHRDGGPAIEHPNGEKEFWIDGEKILTYRRSN